MMRVTRHLMIKSAYILIDVVVISLSIFIAFWIRHDTVSFDVTFTNLFFNPANPFRFILLIWILATIYQHSSNGLYQTRREIFETIEIWNVMRSIIASSLIAIVVVFILKISDFPRSVLMLGAVMMFFMCSIWRIFKRMFVEYLVTQGYNNFNVLIVGAGRVGSTLTGEIAKKPALGMNVVGYLDDMKKTSPTASGPKILGKISDFPKIARREFINKVFITCHHDGKVFLQLLEQAKELGIAVRVVPHGFDLMSGECSKYNIGIIPILEYCDVQRRYNQAGKRLFDLIAGFCLAIICLPVFIVTAILIKLDSPGPVFYLSRRYGRGGRMFNMLKFRSMRQDADQIIDQIKDKNEAGGPIFKIRKDPRVTRIGGFLRKFSFDELPQLLNVIMGHMSLVGPRPLPISQIQKEDLRQLMRLEVRPGITGLWQIRGRSDISFSRLVKWDVWYINNWSFWLDLNILLQTVPVVIRGKGAY